MSLLPLTSCESLVESSDVHEMVPHFSHFLGGRLVGSDGQILIYLNRIARHDLAAEDFAEAERYGRFARRRRPYEKHDQEAQMQYSKKGSGNVGLEVWLDPVVPR